MFENQKRTVLAYIKVNKQLVLIIFQNYVYNSIMIKIISSPVIELITTFNYYNNYDHLTISNYDFALMNS